jgi:predicted porin
LGTELEDIAVWSAGAILGWGPFSIGGGYGDNGDSGRLTSSWAGELDIKNNYWNVAAALEFGRFYLSAGYFESEFEWSSEDPPSKYTHTTLAADYSLAPGLALYGEVDWIEDKLYGDYAENNATAVILGANVSF